MRTEIDINNVAIAMLESAGKIINGKYGSPHDLDSLNLAADSINEAMLMLNQDGHIPSFKAMKSVKTALSELTSAVSSIRALKKH